MNEKLLLINGPNLNMLGRRDPHHYGRFTLKDAERLARETTGRLGYTLQCFQSNHEGDLVDRVQASLDDVGGLMINAGALTHYSLALRDALELCDFPIVEVHISDIKNRESFRKTSVIESVCSLQVAGHGLQSYALAAEHLCRLVAERSAAHD